MCVQRAAELSKSELAFVQKIQEGLSADYPYEDAEIRRLMRICERLRAQAVTALAQLMSAFGGKADIGI